MFFVPIFVISVYVSIPLQFRFVEHYILSEKLQGTLRAMPPPAGTTRHLPLYFVCVRVCVPVPFAFVVLKDGFNNNPSAVLQELKDLVATKIAKYAVPEHFLVRPRPPVTHLTSFTLTSSTNLSFPCVLSLRW